MPPPRLPLATPALTAIASLAVGCARPAPPPTPPASDRALDLEELARAIDPGDVAPLSS
jgi:hypothetical protein